MVTIVAPPADVLTAIPSKVFKLGQTVSAYISSTSNKKTINSPNSQNINKVSTTTDILNWRTLEDLPFEPYNNATAYSPNAFYIFNPPTDGSNYCDVYVNVIDMYGEFTGWVKDVNPMSAGLNNCDAYGNTSIIYNNYLYSFGGVSKFNPSVIMDNFVCPLNADSSLGAWSVINATPTNPGLYPGVAVYSGRIYIFLSGPEPSSATMQGIIYSAIINSDGSLGAWRLEIDNTSGLIDGLGYVKLHVWNEYLICTGASSYTNIVIFKINSDWTLSPIVDAVSGVLVADSLSPSIVIGDELYIFNKGGQTHKYVISLDPNNPTANALLSPEFYLPVPPINNSIGPFVRGDINNEGYIYTIGDSNDGTYRYFNKYPIITGNGITRYLEMSNLLYFLSIDSSILVTGNKVYYLGGKYYGISTDVVEFAKIAKDGTLGKFYETNLLAYPVFSACLIKGNNKVYLVGGFGGGFNGEPQVFDSPINTIQSATINADSSIGTWSTEPNTLPIKVASASSALIGNKIYIIGGTTAVPDPYGSYTNLTNAVQSATINEDGTLSAWSIEPLTLPQGICSGEVVVTNSYVYLIAGVVDVNAGFSSQVIYYTTINADNTLNAWILSPNTVPEYLRDFKLAVTSNKVFLIGGLDIINNIPVNTVYIADINTDGTLSSFVLSSNYLQVPMSNFGIAVTSQYIHLLGGYHFYNNSAIGMIQSAKFDGWANSNTSDYLIESEFTPITPASQVINGDLITVTGNPIVAPGRYLAVKIDTKQGDVVKQFKGEVWYGGPL